MYEVNYKGWRIDVLRHEEGWKVLIYRPSSLLHETAVPEGPDCRSVLEETKAFIDKSLVS